MCVERVNSLALRLLHHHFKMGQLCKLNTLSCPPIAQGDRCAVTHDDVAVCHYGCLLPFLAATAPAAAETAPLLTSFDEAAAIVAERGDSRSSTVLLRVWDSLCVHTACIVVAVDEKVRREG